MAITVPVAHEEMSAETFATPVAQAINQIQGVDLLHLPGRVWVNALSAVNATAGWTTIPGSATKPTEALARRWVMIATMTLDPAEVGKNCYVQWNVNAQSIGQYGIYVPAGNSTFTLMWALTSATAMTSTEILASGWKLAAGGRQVFIDGGP